MMCIYIKKEEEKARLFLMSERETTLKYSRRLHEKKIRLKKNGCKRVVIE
jgi:hypothetical protein